MRQSPRGELDSVHPLPQIDVGEKKIDHRFRLEPIDRVVRIAGLLNKITALAQGNGRVHPNQRLVFHEQNGLLEDRKFRRAGNRQISGTQTL
jgi:hypothetical protein